MDINFSRDGNFPKKYAQVIGPKNPLLHNPKVRKKFHPLRIVQPTPNPSPPHFKKRKTIALS